MLGLRDLILIVIGTVIGSGIFLVPGGVVRQAGGYAGPALVVWIVGGVLSLLGALAYGELGAMNPAAGGLYVYLRDAFGPLTAFLYGWTFFLVIATGSAATLAVASGSYLQQFVALGPFGQKAAAIVLLAVVASLLLLSGQYKQLYTLVIFPSWILYGMTAASVIVLRYKRPDLERPYRVPGYPIVPALFVLVAIALLYSTLQESPRESGIGLVLILAGLPFYYYWKGRRQPGDDD